MQSYRSASQASTQCKAILKAEALQGAGADASAFNCGDFSNYQCERRIFSPDVADMDHSLRECLPGGDNCVDVEVHQFSTGGAHGEPEALFKPGGSYNREEVNCNHKFMYHKVAVFEGQGDSLEQALARAMKACERAGGGQ